MASKLADILQQEYKTKGLISGTASALGKSAKEKMDFKNVLFGGTGLSSILGQKIFGKGYSALDRSKKVSDVSQEISSGSSTILQEISINSSVTAKNTLALPSMARDMFLVKKNIMQLVKLQGGTPSTKAGDWFSRQEARESAYESKFNRATKPTKMEEKKETGGGILGILGTVGSVFASLLKPLSSLTGFITTAGVAVASFGSVIFKILTKLIGSKIGKLLGLTGLAFAAQRSNANPMDMNDSMEENSPSTEKSSFGKDLVNNVVAPVGGTILAASAVSAGSKLYQAGKTTSSAVLNARTMSVGQLANSTQKTTWGKFLAFVARKSPKLWGKIGLKLAQAGALAAIPFIGWIGAAIQLGFTLWTAWELYELWREYNNEEEKDSPTSPEEMPQNRSSMDLEMGVAGVAGSNYTESVNNNTTQTSTRPTRTMGGEPMADLIRTKFKAAGFSDAQAEGAVANARAESSLDPNAFNGKGGEESVGLFQMNRKGGLGEGHSIENLKDPNYNIDLAIAAAKNAKRFKAARTPEEATKAFMLEVERPKDQSFGAQAKRVALLNNTGETLNNGSVAIASRPTSTPSTPSPIVNVDNSRTQMASGSSGAQVSAWDNLMFENMITRVI